jgi:PAS domain S-box-containing protein
MTTMPPATSPEQQLGADNAELRARLEEAEETLRAIRSDEVEALVVETADGPQVFTLQGLDAESNRFRGEILAQVSESVIAVDADQRVTYLNAAAERQYRVCASDALGCQLGSIFTRQWPRAVTEAAMWAGLREHGEWRSEITHRTHDGREIAVETSITMLRDASGAPAGYVGVFREITERKRAEAALAAAFRESADLKAAANEQLIVSTLRQHELTEAADHLNAQLLAEIIERKQAEDALRESQLLTRRVLDNLFAFVGVTTTDGTVTDANRAPLDAAGIPASEVLGKKFWDCHWWSYSPEIQAQLRDAFERAARGEIVRYDVPVRMAGDTRLWIDFQVAPLRDAEGRITHLIPSAMDIGERRAADEKLRASEERTHLATEATAVGIWEWNVLTNAVRWDAAMFRLYGIPPTIDGFVQYSDWSGAVLPEDLPENERILQDTVRACGQSRREFRIHRRDDGALRHIEGAETVRANGQGEIEWMVGTNLDVTERKTAGIRLRQLAADLTESDRRKDEFLATLAHELRNPLAPIRNGLQLIKMTGVQAASFEQTCCMMDRQLTHMVRLIDDLMDVSRITRGKLVLRKEHVPLAAVVNSAVEASRPLVEQTGQELTVRLPRQPLMVDADLTRLAQVFQNLLNNAARYSDPGGHIQVDVEPRGGEVIVTVKDTGIGLAADQLPHIFQMFTQVDRSLERSQGGLGIGLTLVHRLVEMHGGSVEATSEGPGKGSEFVVRLPLVLDASAAQESGGAVEHSVRSSLRILVVDDNQDGADSLSEMLKLVGNDTCTAYDGQAAVDAAGEFRPDVILLDIGMPKLNGYEACRRIREQPGGESIVLIAVTGWGQDDDRRRSHVAGFDHHMVKPVDPRALMELLAGLDVGR